MTTASASKQPNRGTLRHIFDNALLDAYPLLAAALASKEPLAANAQACYDAFSQARQLMVHKKVLPFVAGNDPHNLDHTERTILSTAVPSIYGFINHGERYTASQKSIEAMKKLRPIADAIHIHGLTIST